VRPKRKGLYYAATGDAIISSCQRQHRTSRDGKAVRLRIFQVVGKTCLNSHFVTSSQFSTKKMSTLRGQHGKQVWHQTAQEETPFHRNHDQVQQCEEEKHWLSRVEELLILVESHKNRSILLVSKWAVRGVLQITEHFYNGGAGTGTQSF